MKSMNSFAGLRSSRRHCPRSSTLWLLGALGGALALASLAGCQTSGASSLVKALAKDTNSVSVKVAGPFGTVEVLRNR